MSNSAAREAVARGVALLDAQGPSGWRERIDLDRLGWSTAECPLGQIYGSTVFAGKITTPEPRGERLHFYGFNAPDDGSFSFTDLTAAWKDALAS